MNNPARCGAMELGEKRMMFIEREGLLFRGSNPRHPEEIWHYTEKRWVPYRYYGGEEPEGWGQEVSEARAEALKVNNPHAEHFLYYDMPPWSGGRCGVRLGGNDSPPQARFRCPNCKQKTGVDILYGYPSDDMFEQAERNEVVLGGCMQVVGQPDRQCLSCNHQWEIVRRRSSRRGPTPQL